jgi:hypothetical protein
MDVIHIYCENHMKFMNAVCDKMQSFLLFQQVVHIVASELLSC